MKTRSNLILSLLTMLLLATACNSSSKGNWSDDDKKKFRKEMSEVKELANFGNKKSAWIECYLRKCEANYSSFAAADRDEKGVEIIAMECSNEILANGSVKGNWSNSDKQNFRQKMDAVEELSVFGESKTEWIECFLSRCEANYSSMHEADQDEEGVKKLALECNEYIIGS